MSSVLHIAEGICPICQKTGLIRLDAHELQAVRSKKIELHGNESYSHVIIAGGREAIVKLQEEEIAA